jgi:hypothetical protein
MDVKKHAWQRKEIHMKFWWETGRKFADKLLSLGRYSSLADYGHGVYLHFYRKKGDHLEDVDIYEIGFESVL